MRFRHALCGALAGACMCIPACADTYEHYSIGQKMRFGFASQRLMCKSVESVSVIVQSVKKSFGADIAPRILAKPLTISADGMRNFRPEIIAAMPAGMREGVGTDCQVPPGELTIVDAIAKEDIGDYFLIITKVKTDAGEDFYTWFFNVFIGDKNRE